MKSSISIALILFLFSSPSPQDQNAEHSKPEEGTDNIISETGPSSTRTLDTPEDDEQAALKAATSSLAGLESIVQSIKQEGLDTDEDALEDGNIPLVEPVETPQSPDGVPDTLDSTGGTEEESLTSKLEIEAVMEDVSKAEEPRNDVVVPPEVNKSVEDSIPSFSEWTKLQLAQKKESIINNIKNKSSVVEGKNFASPDCGAKVINSNQEAQNPSGVISSSHDEYMLNRCTANVWFILELCEPLTIESLTLGNLELFSSNPHEFEVGVSDRYPTRDWIVFGPYFAPDSRSLHSFHLPPNNSTFGKYLRIVVKSNHGNEHYCPLSLIKVYGRSEYEVLESETTHAQDMDSDVPGIIEEEMIDDVPVEKSVLGTATAVVMNMVKKAADVLVNKKVETKTDDKKEEAVVSTPTPPSPCVNLWQCVHESESKASIFKMLSCRRRELHWMDRHLRWCGWDTCHDFLEENSIGSPWMPEGLLVAIYGYTIIPTLCHFRYPLRVCHTKHGHDDHFLAGAPNTSTVAPDGTGAAQAQTQTHPDSEDEEHFDGKGNRRVTPESTDSESQPENTSTQFHLPTPPPPVEEPAQKESVFVRLSNRIKALERNQSLSSGYLEELSQRFRKQSEEMHATHEIFRKSLNDSLSKCAFLESTLRYEVRKLNRNLDTLRDLIGRLEMQRSGFFILSLLQILSTIFLWWNGKRGKSAPQPLSDAASSSLPHRGDDPTLEPLFQLTQRKRSCSQQPGTKQKKKKKRREAAAPEEVKSEETGIRIPSSLSTGSIPLGLPAEPPLVTPSPQFEFAPPPIHARLNGGLSIQPAQYSASTNPASTRRSSAHPAFSQSQSSPDSFQSQSPGGRSSSELSETSSTKSQKKKSKLKSFFFGK